MPPALHPRSGFTTSLFTTTLAISFLIVGLPHVLPCPVDPKQYAEGSMEIIDQDGRKVRVRRLPKRRQETMADQGTGTQDAAAKTQSPARDASGEEERSRRGRECPVPKPAGIIGQVLGFKKEEEVLRPIIKVDSTRSRKDVAGESKG